MKPSNGNGPESLVKRIEVVNENGEVIVKHITYYADLLAAAHEVGIRSLMTEAVQLPTDANGQTAVIKAVIETGRGSFCALGDASPQNVESEFLPHIIRVAETRAKARALRDALNIGVVAYEEISGRIQSNEPPPFKETKQTAPTQTAQPQNPPPSSSHPTEIWTDNQRRLIFRLLHKRGIEGDDARKLLSQTFKVSDLSQVHRKAASSYIDQLMRGNGEDRSGETAHV